MGRERVDLRVSMARRSRPRGEVKRRAWEVVDQEMASVKNLVVSWPMEMDRYAEEGLGR